MPFLIQILARIGIGARASIVLERIILLAGRANQYWGRAGYIERRIGAFVVSAIGVGATEWQYFRQVLIDYFSNMFQSVMNELSYDEFIRVGGEAAAREINRQLLKRYGLDSPITNVASETIVEELGSWFAQIINEKAILKTGVQMDIFTTLFPPDNLIPELDAYLCYVIGEKLQIQVDSVLDNNRLLVEIKEQIAQKMLDEFNDQVGELRLSAVQVIKQQFADYSIQDYETAINALDVVVPVFEAKIMAGIKKRIPIFKNIKVTTERTRINNKLRQRAYRLTHREQRVWVAK